MRVDELLRHGDTVVVGVVETFGATVIVVGALWAALRFVVEGLRHRSAAVFTPIRLSLGRFLTLGLEFQLAADILRTAVSPTFAQLGQLAAIATIRTALNVVLRREIAQEQRQVTADAGGRPQPDPQPTPTGAAGGGSPG
ncbi:DUF1622 domain-containing protein [Micromonospora sp. RL09-050-HVF-A]|uniref:DUF1622 domain-containing protein n=1 Tax=Micromonospora sp. RL09-050-HVF-A TaxID=1703433 RepID=UPI001C5CEAD8|nr:DUF1622 domain-containing protein [Micromonospora sp. RL09-050-HVF-A]MBW4701316.1 DUF1622 domain-containing protein [Micromonospora sp. RL09-050-HVF-A]